MKILLKSLAIILLAALGTIGTLFVERHYLHMNTAQDDTIHSAVKQYIENHPQDILDSIARAENFGQTIRNFAHLNEDEVKAMIEKLIPNNVDINNNSEEENQEKPTEEDSNKIYKEHWEEMINSEVSPALGPKDAKVTVVEFFDFACGHCKALAPIMDQIVKNNPDVRFIYEPLFFISEHSPYAAKVALAAFEKGKFAEVYKGIMTLPDLNEEAINQILIDEGLNVDEIKEMIEEKKIRRGVQDIDALSQVLGINGVPALLINGEAFHGRNVEEIQNKLNSYK